MAKATAGEVCGLSVPLESLLFMVPVYERDADLPHEPMACLPGEGLLGTLLAHPGALGPTVTSGSAGTHRAG